MILHLETNNIIKHLQVDKAPILCFSFEHYGPNVANIGWVQKQIYIQLMCVVNFTGVVFLTRVQSVHFNMQTNICYEIAH